MPRALANGAYARDDDDLVVNRNGDVMLIRKDLEKPSKYCSERKEKAKQANGPVRHHAGEHERNAERKYHGPGCGLRELDGADHGSMPVFRRVSLNEPAFFHRCPHF